MSASKCGICSHTVYPVDPQINLNGSIYHKICAKCVDCRCQITVSNFTKSGDTLLCKTHYIKRFNEQGTHLGSDKFKQQAVRGLAAYNPTTDPSNQPAAAPSSTTSPKGFSDDPERTNSVKDRMKKFANLTNTPKCAICERSVYANDPQVVLDGLSYHRACAKCTECKCQITIQNFTKSGTTLYCKTHYIKKFKEEGTILGSEKFTHQSAPGKFAGSGFTIPGAGGDAISASPSSDSQDRDLRSSTSVDLTAELSQPPAPVPAPAPAPAPAPVPEPIITPAPQPVVEEPVISESEVTLEDTSVAIEPVAAAAVVEPPIQSHSAPEPQEEEAIPAATETEVEAENPTSPNEDSTPSAEGQQGQEQAAVEEGESKESTEQEANATVDNVDSTAGEGEVVANDQDQDQKEEKEGEAEEEEENTSV